MTSSPPHRAVDIDYAALFAATPTPYLILTPELVICEVNQAYLDATETTREEILGRPVFEVFPDNPGDPSADGVHNLRTSLRRVIATGRRDSMAVQRYDIRVRDAQGRARFQRRYWSPVNTPVLDDAGTTRLIIHRAEDITDYVRDHGDGGSVRVLPIMASAHEQATETDILARGQDLQQVNDQLRAVAVALQAAMLPSVRGALGEAHTTARYRPAVDSINVCGDWYDITELDDSRLAVAVGDVVGHGIEAAGTMGQLRSALVAATIATHRPDRAIEALDLYARSIAPALGSTAVKLIVDFATSTISYSRAGHLPPVLVRSDGSAQILEQASGPPLGIAGAPRQRPCAEVPFAAGDLLALYTDGLVERRTENIQVGIDRLVDCLRRHAPQGIEQTADAVLAEGPFTDDTALVLVAL